jgi:AbrB family looped-hinge helix DNA binding protein
VKRNYGSVILTVFYSSSVDVRMYNEKVLGDSRLLKGGRVTIPKKVREKLSIKDGDFLTFIDQERIRKDKEIRI